MSLTAEQLTEETDRFNRLNTTADAIFLDVARTGRILKVEEISVLHAAGYTTKDSIESQLSRCERVLRYQQQAGTKEERSQVVDEIKKATRKRDKEIPTLRQELEDTVVRLNAKIAELEDAVARPSQKLAAMNAAADALRSDNLLPKFVQDAVNMRKSGANRGFRKLFDAKSTCETGKKRLECLSTVGPECHGKPTLNLRRSGSELTRNAATLIEDVLQLTFTDEAGRVLVCPKKLADARVAIAREVEEAEAIIAELGPQRDAALEDNEKLRDFYVQ